MPQARVLSLDSSHGRFAHQMITLINQAGIDRIAIGDVQKAAPPSNGPPQALKGLKTAIAYDPLEDARLVAVDGTPEPNFVFLEPIKVCNSSS